MTLDKLKAEAKAQGYTLVPIRQYTKLRPCKCGNNRREHWSTVHGEVLVCTKCGFTSPEGKTEREARENWNKAVEVQE